MKTKLNIRYLFAVALISITIFLPVQGVFANTQEVTISIGEALAAYENLAFENEYKLKLIDETIFDFAKEVPLAIFQESYSKMSSLMNQDNSEQKELKKQLEAQIKKEEIKQISYEIKSITNYIVPMFTYTRSYSEDKKIYNNLVGWANIRLTCVATIYDETISFVSISDINSRQYGYALNFVSWTQNRTFYGIGGTGQTAGICFYRNIMTLNRRTIMSTGSRIK